jgi:hypothetical protein
MNAHMHLCITVPYPNIHSHTYKPKPLYLIQAIAVDVVTSHVRREDPSLSDEKARSVLGALGLIGEKAMRKVYAP